MTKTKKYSDLLSKFLKEFAEQYKNASDGLITIPIIDTEGHHYQIAVHGFQEKPKKHVFSVQFHFDIIGEKIWFQCNHTDLLIEDELLELGIPKSDIVLGWLPEYARLHSGWGKGEKAA